VRSDGGGGGVGSALLDAVVGWCAERGVHAAILWPTARSAALYRRHGFRPPEALLERTFGTAPETQAEIGPPDGAPARPPDD
jgi:GNAT superfamily N-acetyltransferase